MNWEHQERLKSIACKKKKKRPSNLPSCIPHALLKTKIKAPQLRNTSATLAFATLVSGFSNSGPRPLPFLCSLLPYCAFPHNSWTLPTDHPHAFPEPSVSCQSSQLHRLSDFWPGSATPSLCWFLVYNLFGLLPNFALQLFLPPLCIGTRFTSLKHTGTFSSLLLRGNQVGPSFLDSRAAKQTCASYFPICTSTVSWNWHVHRTSS